MKKIIYLFSALLFIACKQENTSSGKETNSNKQVGDTLAVDYAKGFEIIDYDTYKILKVKEIYPGSDKEYTYLLTQRGERKPKGIDYDVEIKVPVKKMVATSTTHIPSIESLEETNTLIGFPEPAYISSPKVSQLIKEKKVQDLGINEDINIEKLISLQPDVMVGFTAQKENNKSYVNIQKSGIPLVYNGDWIEQSPLGKAEWIKFFGALYNKEEQAEKEFLKIEKKYKKVKEIAKDAENKPTVLTGSLMGEHWHVPKGDSWAAHFLKDAAVDYLFKNITDSGSQALTVEEVLDKAQDADIWIAPGGYVTYEQLAKSSQHHKEFEAFKNKKVYDYGAAAGESGGLLYFELGPNRPDLVLQDLVAIFHPELVEDYEPTFYKELQ